MYEQLSSAARDGAVILTANQRLARTYRRVFDSGIRASGQRAWTPPRILPWTTWVNALWFDAVMDCRMPAATRLNTDQCEMLWRAIIDASPDSGEILQSRAAAISSMRAWSLLHEYRIPWKRIAFSGHQDWAAFSAWARQFESRCRRENWLDDARLPDVVAAGIRGGMVAVPRRVLLGGFDGLTPQQSALLDALAAAGCGYELVAITSPTGTASRVESLDAGAELRDAARWAHALLQQESGTNIGVVIPRLAERRVLADRIFTEVLHPDRLLSFTEGRPSFHISLGQSLREWPLTHAALLALRLLRPMLSLADASAILRCPYYGGGRSEASERATLDARLRRGRPIEIPTAAIDRWQLPPFATTHDRRPSDWARQFTALLNAVRWPGEVPLTSTEHQLRDAWEALLNRFASLDLVMPPVPFDVALSRLDELAGASGFQPEDPGAPVQIVGVLEAAGAGFDHLWIAGLDDESWPEPPQPHPFLPPSLQIEYALPHCSAAREFEFTQRTTGRLFASAPSVVVSHACRDGDRSVRPSIFIRDLPRIDSLPDSDEYTRLLAQRSALESIEDATAPPLPGSLATGGVRILKYQAQCPFRAFAELRLNARSLEAGSLGVDPIEHGNALHRALELFWREARTHQRLSAMTAHDVDALLRDVSTSAVDRAIHPPSGDLDRRFRDLEIERVHAVLSAWLETERQREPFEVAFTEDKREIEVGGLRLTARIDRVDRTRSGDLVVIDYKTRAPALKSWEDDRIDEPQLPLYATSLNEPVTAAVFAQLTPGDLRFKGVAEREMPGVKPLANGETMQQRLQDWRRALAATARQFVDGRACVDPKKGACDFCGLTPLCRIHEQEAVVDAV